MTQSRLLRSAVSYLPDAGALWLRHFSTVVRRRRLHEPELELVGRFGSSPHIVDVGGNRGQTIASVRSVVPGARVWTFEPNPRLARWLEQRFAGDLSVIQPYGLGDVDLDTELFVPRYGQVSFDTRASLDPSVAASFLCADHFWRFAPGRAHVDVVSIKIRRLDDQALSPDIVKVDVEGVEEHVISGGWRTISDHRPLLIVEGVTPALIERLGSLEYVAHRWERGRLVMGSGSPYNTIFVGPNQRSVLADLL